MQTKTSTPTLVLFMFSVLFGLQLRGNDDCANAIALQPGNSCVTTTGSFSGTTLSGEAPSCANTASQDVWFSFVATEKTMGISLNAVSGLNHGFEIIAGNCSGSSVICVNNSGFGNAETYLGNNFTVGETYLIRVFNANTLPVSSTFNICVQQYAEPANNNCENAALLTPAATCQPVSGSLSGSSITGNAPACQENALQDVWYKFTATDSTMSITLEASSGLNHGFELISGNCNGSVLNCVNSGSSGNSESFLGFDFVIGQEYYIRVFNAGTALSTASFGICIRDFPAPSNDACANAISLTPGSACNITNANLSGSGISGALPTCADQASQDIWFKFVADDKTMSVNLAATGGLNHGFEIYQNNCSGSLVVCMNNNTSGIGEFYINTNFTVGETYFIRVFNVNPAYFSGITGICVQHYPSPDNETCAGSTVLTPGVTCVNTAISFSGSGVEGDLPSCGNSASQDIWYQFTATQAKMSISLSAVSGLNHGFEILNGNCSGSLIACVNANASGTNETYLNNNFTPGQTYFIRVFNAGTGFNTSGFNICVQEFAVPSNNNCSNARIIVPQASCTNISSGFSGASIAQPAPSCAPNAAQDVWFKFKAADSTMNIALTATAGLNHGFEIISNGCGGAVLTCVNSNGSGAVELFAGKIFAPGEDYLVRVFNVNPTLSLAAFNICVFGTIQPCVASVEITANDSSVCEGTAVNFTAVATNGGPFPDFQWKVNGQDAGSNSPTFTLENPADGDVVHCEMSSSDPCAGPEAIPSGNISLEVEAAILPAFSTPGPFCEGTEFTLPVRSENDIDGSWTPEVNTAETTTYTFSPVGEVCATNAQLTVTIEEKIIPQFTDIFPICRGTGLTLPASSLNNITGNWQPEPNDTLSTVYTFTPDEGQCADETTLSVSVQFADTSISLEGNSLVSGAVDAEYQWVNCDDNFTIIDGETNREYLITANGSFAVIVNQAGCIDTSRCIEISTVGLQPANAASFSIYPNPARELSYLISRENLSGETFQLINQTGKLIFTGTITGKLTVLNLQELPGGVYFLRFNNSGGAARLVKL